MKYTPHYTNRIKRQLKALKKRRYDMNLFKETVDMLLDGKPLPPSIISIKKETEL